MAGILVFIEHVDGKVNRATYEALRAAQLIGAQTGQEISAVIFGQGIGAAASEVAGKKISAVHTVESEWLKSYTADGYTQAFKQVIEQIQPELVLMAHTYEVRDFAPKLAASLRRALVGDCISYKIESGELVLTRQVFQGKMAADVVPVGDKPHFVSFQIGSFRGDECDAGQAEIKSLTVNLDADVVRQQPESASRKRRPPLI